MNVQKIFIALGTYAFRVRVIVFYPFKAQVDLYKLN